MDNDYLPTEHTAVELARDPVVSQPVGCATRRSRLRCANLSPPRRKHRAGMLGAGEIRQRILPTPNDLP